MKKNILQVSTPANTATASLERNLKMASFGKDAVTTRRVAGHFLFLTFFPSLVADLKCKKKKKSSEICSDLAENKF